jgi:hypothetical protein
MRLLSFIYRIISNFAFLALAYFSLNYIEKYNNRAVLAILILVYAVMRAVSALRSFYFYSRIERLEVEARRLVSLIAEGPTGASLRKQLVGEVSLLRRDGEIKAYIDLFFLVAVVLVCVAKIVTD